MNKDFVKFRIFLKIRNANLNFKIRNAKKARNLRNTNTKHIPERERPLPTPSFVPIGSRQTKPA